MPTPRRRSPDRNGSPLTELVREGVHSALLARLRVQAEQEGELLAREILQDEAFRQEFVALAREVAREALEQLRERRGR